MCIRAIYNEDLYYGSGQRALSKKDSFHLSPSLYNEQTFSKEALTALTTNQIRHPKQSAQVHSFSASIGIGWSLKGIDWSLQQTFMPRQEGTAGLLITPLSKINIKISKSSETENMTKLRARKSIISILFYKVLDG